MPRGRSIREVAPPVASSARAEAYEVTASDVTGSLAARRSGEVQATTTATAIIADITSRVGTRPSSRNLADAYDVTDGSRPDCWGYIVAHGIDEQSGQGIDAFR